MKCWGNGPCGDGTTVRCFTPVAVSGLSSGVKAISAGGHTCALMVDAGVRWGGANYYGQLGDGTTTDRLVPTNVLGL